MTTLYWPTGLPQTPFRSSYRRGAANNTLRVAPEYGPAKTRRRASSNTGSLACVYHLKEDSRAAGGGAVDQKRLFLDFYALVDCFASFWLPNPEDPGEYLLARIKPSSESEGVELVPYACRTWTVTLQLEVWPLVPAKPRSVEQ